MKFPHTKLNSKGIAHFVAPLLVVVAIGLIGVMYFKLSHAATTNSTTSSVSTNSPTMLDAGTMQTDYSQALAADSTVPKTNCEKFPNVPLCGGSSSSTATAGSSTATTDSGADAAGMPCSTSKCGDVVYHGGSVLQNPKIYWLDWGPKWQSETKLTPSIDKLVGGLGVESYPSAPDKWSSTLSQYYDGNGAPWTYNGKANVYIDSNAPPKGVTPTQMKAEAAAFLKSQSVAPSQYSNTLVVVALQQGACPAGSDTCGITNPTYCAEHGYGTTTISGTTYKIPFVNLPYLPDGPCPGSNPPSQIYTGSAGHEIAETITDPLLDGWWNETSPGEIADECGQPVKGLNWKDGTVYMPALYSNAAGGCVYSSGVQGQVLSHNGYCVDDFTSGVANGNKIDTWGCNQTNAQMITKFPDNTLRVLGRCIDDPSNGGSGTLVQLNNCNGNAWMTWTHNASTGAYVNKANGLCLRNTPNGQPFGAQLTVYSCNGNNNQNWSLPL